MQLGNARTICWYVVFVGPLACAPTQVRSHSNPAATVAAWAAAVQKSDADQAYALLSTAVRSQLIPVAFAQEWQSIEQERHEQAKQLEDALQIRVVQDERARLLVDGAAVQVAREAGGWRLETPLLEGTHAATPQDALRHLVSALSARNFDAVMHSLSSTRREGMKSMVDAFAANLQAHSGDGIEISGDHATFMWSDGQRRWKVTLLLEDGEWRIDELVPVDSAASRQP